VFIFPTGDAPKYTRGYGTSVALIAFAGCCCIAYLLACSSQNRARDKSGVFELTEYEKLEKGDRADTYRYML